MSEAELGLNFEKKKTKKAALGEDVLNDIFENSKKLFNLDEKIAQKRKRDPNAEITQKKIKCKDAEEIEALIQEIIDEKKTKAAAEPAPAAEEQQQPTDKPAEEATPAEEQSLKSKKTAQDFEEIKNEDYNKWTLSNRDYYYPEILERIFQQLKQKNPQHTSGKKVVKVKPPMIVRDGPKKVRFVNFDEICQDLRRNPEHVMQYFFAELCTTGSVDGNKHLILRSVFRAPNIERVLQKYISEYVSCRVCGSSDTLLSRDANTRLHTLVCQSCSAHRAVQAFNKGFVANLMRRSKRTPEQK